MRKAYILRVGVVFASLTLSGCAAVKDRFPILSLLDSPPRPPSLEVRAVAVPSLPRYRAISHCQYNGRLSDGTGRQSSSQTLVIRPVRDRLLVTSTIGSEQSTALISPTGQRLDFNTAEASGGRLTPETFDRTASGGGPAMNNIDLYIPSYKNGAASPGDIVSWLHDSAGVVRAAFVYRGLVTYNNREAILLDLVISSGEGDIGRSVGFSIVDQARALPLLFAAAGRPSIRGEQIDCRD